MIFWLFLCKCDCSCRSCPVDEQEDLMLGTFWCHCHLAPIRCYGVASLRLGVLMAYTSSFVYYRFLVPTVLGSCCNYYVNYNFTIMIVFVAYIL
jgi:aminopeptidase-like protein